MKQEDEYEAWRKGRQAAFPAEDLTDRIMAAIDAVPCELSTSSDKAMPLSRRFQRTGPILLWTVASLIFAARITALIGNLIFPTGSHPELAVDQRTEEPDHEHRSISRS